MFKHCLLSLAVAGLISMVAPFAAAQDAQTNDQQPGPMQGDGGHRGAPDPARRTQQLTKQLNLTSDQQTKVQDILQSERTQMESLRQDTSTPQQDRRSKMMEIRKSTDQQIRGLLDSNQQRKWDAMQARREQKMESRRGQQGPPAQQ
jgi:periplasmic protein CpxP/Spy